MSYAVPHYLFFGHYYLKKSFSLSIVNYPLITQIYKYFRQVGEKMIFYAISLSK